jgi:sialic acid synthase SpsE
MPAEVTITSIKDAVIGTLRDALESVSDDIKQDWEDYAQDIARDIAIHTQRAINRGNTMSKHNVRHLRAQAMLLATMIAIREQNRIADIITNVLTISLQVLGRAVFGVLVS